MDTSRTKKLVVFSPYFCNVTLFKPPYKDFPYKENAAKAILLDTNDKTENFDEK